MITAVAAFKGGVGKTTSALILSDILSASGSVLVVDVDPQANLTKYFGVKLADIKKKNVLNAIESGNLKKNIMSISKNIDLLPSTIALSDFEAKFAQTAGKELLLKDLLKASGYDRVIIDTQPAMTIITRNALFAADRVIVPVEPDEWSVEGALSLVKNIEAFRTSPLKNEIAVQDVYVLPTKFKTLSMYEGQYKKIIANVFGGYTTLPRLGFYSDIKSHRSNRTWKKTAGYYKDYQKVAEEIWQNR